MLNVLLIRLLRSIGKFLGDELKREAKRARKEEQEQDDPAVIELNPSSSSGLIRLGMLPLSLREKFPHVCKWCTVCVARCPIWTFDGDAKVTHVRLCPAEKKRI